MNKILYAARLAAEVHADQKRKWTGDPYVIHPMRVAGKVATLKYSTEDMVAAAWLHDAFEESKEPFGVLEARIVKEDVLGPDVVKMMVELTSGSKRTTGWKDRSREERKRFDRQALRDVSNPAKVIKLVDRIDNLLDIPSIDKSGNRPDYRFVKMYAEESLALLGALEGVDQTLENQLRLAAEDLLWRVTRWFQE